MEKKPYKILEEIFTNQINVLNIAVPTIPLSIESAKVSCLNNNYDIHLVQEPEKEDLVIYIRRLNSIRPLNDSEVISESTPILDVVDALCTKEQLFIKVKRNITHLVTRSDLDAIQVRIWLFGMINLFEIELKETINHLDMNWERLLSTKRIDKAKELFELKKSRNEEIDLLGCIQFSDLGTILSNSWERFEKYFPPYLVKENINSNFNKINILRDAIAHGQKLQLEWSKIHELMQLISYSLGRI